MMGQSGEIKNMFNANVFYYNTYYHNSTYATFLHIHRKFFHINARM